MLFAGCGGAASTADVKGTDDSVSYAESSPLGAYFIEDGGSDAAMREWQYSTQELIASCMKAEGFDFVPSVAEVPDMMSERSELSERAWTEAYGYGISTAFESLTQMQAADPNLAIMSAMDEVEQEIYIATLIGSDMASGDIVDPAELPPLEEQGCAGQAVLSNGGEALGEGLNEFNVAYGEAMEQVQDNPAMVAAADKWSVCMSGEGYDFADQEDSYEYVSVQFDEATSSLQSELDHLSDAELSALFDGTDTNIANLPGFDPEDLKAVQKEEIEIALADLDCYELYVAEVFEPLRDEIENGLILEYSNQLDAVRDLTGG